MTDSGRNRAGFVIMVIGVVLSLVGIGLPFVPRTVSDANGYSLSCGSATFRDQDALREYSERQLDRFREAAQKFDAQFIPAPTAHPELIPMQPSGAGLVGIEALAPENLRKRCAEALTTMRSAAGILFTVGVLAILVGLAVWERRVRDFLVSMTEGARLPTWMVTCPEWVQAALVTFSGLTGALAGIVTGWWRVVAIIATLGLVVFAVLISIARSAENTRRNKQLEALKADHRADTQNLLGNELHALVQVTAEAVATENRADRCAAAAAARHGLVSAAAHLVGKKGTRANLFRSSSDGKSMALEPGRFAGRGVRSSRVFTVGDKTFDLAIVEQGRFVTSAKGELVGAERDVPYETFMTYPVSIGPARVHGVLTVDSLKSGDLDEPRDTPIMALLSALIAVTYECEKYDNAVI